MISISLICALPFHRARVTILKLFRAKIQGDVTIYHGLQVRRARSLSIGARSIVGDSAILDARGGLYIGSDVNLSSGVHIWTGQHDWQDSSFRYVSRPVRIHRRVWAGDRVTILPGVTIGEGAVLAAGAVVTSDVEPYTLVGGNPAKKIGDRNRELTYRLRSHKHKVWFW